MRELPPDSFLARIVASKRDELATVKAAAPLDDWIADLSALPPPRDFAAALRRGPADPIRVIAEVKKASPSRGIIREEFDPVAIATGYADNGAAAISVLTDKEWFQGDLTHLDAVRKAVRVPLLRKDFTLDPYHVYEARRHGADAVLLIAALLDDGLLKDLMSLAGSLRMCAVVEVHDAEELDRALKAGARVVGINNRDLVTFETDLTVTGRLLPAIPRDVVRISESGIQRRAQVVALEKVDVDAVLVGESLMREADPGAALKALLSP
jgi:indole-3-glycerol phosphate synthase